MRALGSAKIGYDLNEDQDSGARPAVFVDFSSTTVSVPERIVDCGSTYRAGAATHSLTLYRDASGALVFSAGTIQWSWGLDVVHDSPTGATSGDVRMQQATLNLLTDMGVQPATPQSGLVTSFPSVDRTPPTSSITSPVSGSIIAPQGAVQITGTAIDQDGAVAAVEVSVDAGATWHPATGRESWTFAWTPTSLGSVTVRSRAVDDSGNVESPTAGISVTIIDPQCPCSLWDPAAPVSGVDFNDANAIEVGVKFRADVGGFITGLRFYKSAANTGTHVGNLWTTAGALLATATFTGESATGWQQVTFATPIAVVANTVYVASYYTPVGHYVATRSYFATTGVDTPVLHAPASGSLGNGVYRYGASAFPTATYTAANYWVDVVFTTTLPTDTTPPTVTALSPASGATSVGVTTPLAA